MIRYALVCDAGHGFESWFSNSAGFEDQARRGFVSCPACGSAKVERAIMAPNLARTDRGVTGRDEAQSDAAEPSADAPATHAPTEAAPVALMGDKEIALRQMLAAVHAHVTQNAEHVGKRFAQEAVKIHHGESENRAIYGEATPEDAEMLREEGVAFMPLPKLPQDRN